MVKVSNRTKKYFINKGYTENDGYFKVNLEDMNSTNRTKVSCKCDFCGKINDISWCNYVICIDDGIYSCHKCHYNKSKIIFINRYGVEHPTKLESIKEKTKKTCLEKYGIEYASQTEENKNKVKKTNLENYGVEYQISSNATKNKIKNTLLCKYKIVSIFDKLSPFRNDINLKLKESLNNECVKNKRKETCLKRYGVENTSQSEEIKNKIKKTNLEKYGFEFVLQLENIKNKSKKTCLEKYGYENYSKTKEWYERTKQIRIKNGQQIPDELKTKYEIYRKRVNNLTSLKKLRLFENWDGYDYYDNEYIKENLKLSNNSKFYPTIDHKISVYYGFINNIPPEEISKIENLCITKRSINSSKRDKNDYEFKI